MAGNNKGQAGRGVFDSMVKARYRQQVSTTLAEERRDVSTYEVRKKRDKSNTGVTDAI